MTAKKIVIFGNSEAAVGAIEAIRATDSSSDITLVSFDSYYPYNRGQLDRLLAQEMTISQIMCRPKSFYEQHRVEFLEKQNISRINLKRGRISTEDKTAIDFDTLLVTDMPQDKFPNIKGIHRSGVYATRRLGDISQIVDTAALVDTIAVQSNTWRGLQIALSLLRWKKEVVLILSDQRVMSSLLGDELWSWLVPQWEARGLRLVRDNAIVEILGDTDAKAIRLKSGKVLASQMILFPDAKPDLKLLDESNLKIEGAIYVDADFKTSVPNVYAAGDVCGLWRQTHQADHADSVPGGQMMSMEPSGLNDHAFPYMEGVCAGHQIAGRPFEKQPLTAQRLLSTEGISIYIAGEMSGDQMRVQNSLQGLDQPVYKKIWLKDGVLSGCLLVNADQERGRFLDFINHRTNLSGMETNILEPASGIGQHA